MEICVKIVFEDLKIFKFKKMIIVFDTIKINFSIN